MEIRILSGELNPQKILMVFGDIYSPLQMISLRCLNLNLAKVTLLDCGRINGVLKELWNLSAQTCIG